MPDNQNDDLSEVEQQMVEQVQRMIKEAHMGMAVMVRQYSLHFKQHHTKSEREQELIDLFTSEIVNNLETVQVQLAKECQDPTHDHRKSQ